MNVTLEIIWEECDAPIPEAVYIKIPGLVLYVLCQQVEELKEKYYRGAK